jgi:sigma-B regulation protein RsbU (phosphoserine phosphatase)
MTSTESPARRLIDETCRHFLETCGWPLRFVPAGSALEAPENLWRRAMSDGRTTVGELLLDLPEDERLDAEFLQMTKAAELIGGLMEEAITAQADAEASRGEVETMARIGSTLPRQADLPSALNHLLRAVTQLTGFRVSAFFLLDPTGDQLTLRMQHDADRSEVPARRRVLADDIPDIAAFAGGPVVMRRSRNVIAATWLPRGACTGVCVAVRSEHAPLGTLWMFDRRDRHPEKRELDVLESIAAQLAVVLERAVLVRESQSEKRLRRHLRAALETQPGQKLTEPGTECGFESAGACRSAFEIGGDLVELIPLDPRRTLVAIGDASGDGVPAAMVMASVRGAVRALAVSSQSPWDATDEMMAQINRALCEITPPHQFMSLLLGVFDSVSRTFCYTNAGHPTPLLVREGTFTNLQSHGMLVGVMEDAQYERSTLDLDPDDLLVFCTDGISEAMGRDQRLFRSDGIAGAVRGALGRPPTEIVNTVWSHLDSHQRGAGGGDDRSLLVMRVK